MKYRVMIVPAEPFRNGVLRECNVEICHDPVAFMVEYIKAEGIKNEERTYSFLCSGHAAVAEQMIENVEWFLSNRKD